VKEHFVVTKLLKMAKNVIVDTMMMNVMINVAILGKLLIEIDFVTSQLEVVLVEHKLSAGI
jgi:hypothetical protein